MGRRASTALGSGRRARPDSRGYRIHFVMWRFLGEELFLPIWVFYVFVGLDFRFIFPGLILGFFIPFFFRG